MDLGQELGQLLEKSERHPISGLLGVDDRLILRIESLPVSFNLIDHLLLGDKLVCHVHLMFPLGSDNLLDAAQDEDLVVPPILIVDLAPWEVKGTASIWHRVDGLSLVQRLNSQLSELELHSRTILTDYARLGAVSEPIL